MANADNPGRICERPSPRLLRTGNSQRCFARAPGSGKAANGDSCLSRFATGSRGVYYEHLSLQQIVGQDNDGTARDNPMALSRVHGTLDAVVLLLRFRCGRVLRTSRRINRPLAGASRARARRAGFQT